uniref:O-acetyl-ADP-ribose deacetylase n=1 Tax=Sipha flava TaxID=143950 RepID=A0A2S2QR77_9HEMI
MNTHVNKMNNIIQTKNYLKEIDENLFNLSGEVSLAHCVAEDLRMGDGIAMEFKHYFGGIGQLFDQNLTVGNVGVVVNNRNETAFYLVTKKYSGGKSTMQSLSVALKSLLQKMKEMKLSKLGISKIGCGWDGLNWAEVKALIASVFAGSRIRITVCVPSKIYKRILPPQLKAFITPKELLDTKAISDILLFIDIEQFKKNNWTNDLVDKVNVKYPSFKERLLRDIRSNQFSPGDVTSYFMNKERINCLFISPTAYYSSLEKGFTNIKKHIRSYKHFVFQSGPIKPADNFKHISRMVLIMRSIIYSSELWLCGDKDLTKETEVFDTYYRNIINEIKLASRQATVSNRPKAVDLKQNNTPSNNQKRKNAPSRKNFQRR